MANPYSKTIQDLVHNNPGHYSYQDLADRFNIPYEQVRGVARCNKITHLFRRDIIRLEKEKPMSKTKKQLTAEARLEGQLRSLKDNQSQENKKYKAVLDDNAKLQKALDDALALRSYKAQPFEIKTRPDTKDNEATAVALLSDVHNEEVVQPHKVNYLNEYNPEISDKRVARFHELVAKLIGVHREHNRIDNLLLWWGGDFFTNDMHGAPTAMGPAPAVLRSIDQLTSGLNYLLKFDPKLKIHIVGSVGNHSRAQTQKPVNQALEQENSWEWMMYHTLRASYKHEKRITWTLENSYHSYVTVYNKVLRFNHGHLGWKYNMGLGGVHGPLWKVISQTWDKQHKADLTICGHYHTLTPAAVSRPYIVNGSAIGVTPYGMNFGFEPPAQMFFLLHSKHFILHQTPLYLEE